MISITINISGGFEGLVLNDRIQLQFSSIPNLKDLLSALNQRFNLKVFNARSISKDLIAVLINGTRISKRDVKKTQLSPEDVITIVQPIIGG